MNTYLDRQPPTPPGPRAPMIKRLGLAGMLLLLLLALAVWHSPAIGGGHQPAAAPAHSLASRHSRARLSMKLARLMADTRTAAAILLYLLEPENTPATNYAAIPNASPVVGQPTLEVTSKRPWFPPRFFPPFEGVWSGSVRKLNW